MAVTRKDTRALLTLIWSQCHDAYMIGYTQGRDGVETPKSPFNALRAANIPAADIAQLSKMLNDMIDTISKADEK